MDISLRSPAKVNLFLRVTGKRSDGYHSLSTLMHTIDWCDRLDFSLSNQDVFTCSDPSLPVDGTNLVQKARDLFRKKTGCDAPVRLHLEKHIPHQAGLGGGSSNAATVLWGLNDLFGLPATEEQLMLWAADIGSDVAFFLSRGLAYCEGRGERVREEKVEGMDLGELEVTLVKPGYGLSTPAVFQALDLSTCCEHSPEICLQSFFSSPGFFINDLELPAFRLAPQLKSLKETLLQKGFHTVALSGSGTAFCCFGEGEIEEKSELQVHRTRLICRSDQGWYGEEKRF